MSACLQMIADDDASKELLKLLKLARTSHGAVDSVMRPPSNGMVYRLTLRPQLLYPARGALSQFAYYGRTPPDGLRFLRRTSARYC